MLTAGPNGLKFFVDTHGWPGGVLGLKNSKLKKKKKILNGQRRALQLVIV